MAEIKISVKTLVDHALDKLKEMDIVPVVRCKNCRYADDYYHDGSIYCCIPDKPMRWHDDDPNWFCADGKPKDGDENGQCEKV